MNCYNDNLRLHFTEQITVRRILKTVNNQCSFLGNLSLEEKVVNTSQVVHHFDTYPWFNSMNRNVSTPLSRPPPLTPQSLLDGMQSIEGPVSPALRERQCESRKGSCPRTQRKISGNGSTNQSTLVFCAWWKRNRFILTII